MKRKSSIVNLQSSIFFLVALLLTVPCGLPPLALAWENGPWRGLDAAYKTKWVILDAVALGTTNTTGDGKAVFVWPETGVWSLVNTPGAAQDTASTSGVLTVQIRRVQLDADAADMLSTKITVAENGKDSSATTAPAIGTSYTVTTGDKLYVDIDVSGNGKGCQVRLPFRKQ